MTTPSQQLRISTTDQESREAAFGRSVDSRPYAVGKRLIDIVVALPVVVFVLPVLMLVVAVVHVCASRGPLFYRQERCGRNRKVFSILKFRTMTPVTVQQWEVESDSASRVFRGGHLVRFSKIDEVPQFVNVLRGEMTIVGPRPHHLQDCYDFEARVAGYQGRHIVKPGITGLAQIREFAGEFRWNCTDSRVASDLEYIESRSLTKDVYLMVRTFSTVGLKCQERLLSSVIQLRSPEFDGPLSMGEPEIELAEKSVPKRTEKPRRAA